MADTANGASGRNGGSSCHTRLRRTLLADGGRDSTRRTDAGGCKMASNAGLPDAGLADGIVVTGNAKEMSCWREQEGGSEEESENAGRGREKRKERL